MDIGELRGTISLKDEFSAGVNKFASALGVSGESFKAITGFAGVAAAAIGSATAAMVMLGQRGSDVADVRGAFESLTVAGGGSEKMLAALREGTLGTISDFDLMQKSNGLLASGLVKSAADMGVMAAGAKLLADRTGGDTAQAFDTLSSAMASGRTNSLKQLGLFVDTDAAVKNYAASLGKSVKELSDTEVAQAKSAGTLAALKAQLAAAGPATADFSDNVARGKVAIKNFTDNLAVAVASSPVVKAGMDAIGTAMQSAFGGNQQDTVKTLMKFVNEFAIGLTYVAQTGVTAAGVIVTAFYAVKTVVLGLETAVSGIATVLVSFVEGLANMGSEIPLIGDKVKGFAEGARSLQSSMMAATGSLADQTKEAFEGVKGNSELHRTIEALGGGVMLARDAMVAARDAQVEMGSSAQVVKSSLTEAGSAAVLTAEQIAKMKEASERTAEAMAATAGGIYEAFARLQNDLTLANLTGIEQRLAEIEIGRQQEIASLAEFAAASAVEYEMLVAMVNEKYSLMAAAANQASISISAAFSQAASESNASLQQQADGAVALYNSMLVSGLFTAQQLEEAWKKAEESKAKLSAEAAQGIMSTNQALTQGAIQLFSALGEKFKVAAIAGAIIATYSAVAKALASAPWPANLLLAAGALAAGMANVAKIRSSQAGFAEGTPGTRFENFGAGTSAVLHGSEAVVTAAQGQSVAGMVESALLTRDSALLEKMDVMERTMRGLRDDSARERRLFPIMLKSALEQARA